MTKMTIDEAQAEWDKLNTILETRRKFHDAVVEKYPPTHVLYKHVKTKLAEAQAAMAAFWQRADVVETRDEIEPPLTQGGFQVRVGQPRSGR